MPRPAAAPTPVMPTPTRERLAHAMVVAFVLALPLAVNPWGFQQRLPVAWLVVLVVVPLGLAAAVRAAGTVFVDATQRWWLAFLAVLVAAVVAGVAPLTSLIGSPARRLGLVGWAALAVAFWWGVQVGRSPRTVDLVARAVVVGAIPVAVIGLVERGERFFSFGSGLDLVRSASTLKNAAFLGAYLALVIPVALAMALSDVVPRRWRAVATVATLVCVTTLVFSQTRAAWIGAAVGIALVIVARRRGTGGKRPVRLVAAGVAAVAVAVSLVAPVRDRALSVASVGTGSNQARAELWMRALPAIADRPVLGYGPDATLLAYPHVIDARFERDVSRRTLPDRAHTLALDLLLWGGIPALVAGGGLVVAVARRVRRSGTVASARAPAAGRPSAAVGIGAGLAAYLVQLLFSFPLADLDALVWLLAGLLVAPSAKAVRLPGGFARGVAGIAVLAGLGAGGWQVRDVVADRQLRVAADADARGDAATAEREFRAATSTAGERAQYWQALGRYERFVGEATKDPDRFASSLAAHRRALQLLPGDTSYELDLADTELSQAEAGLTDPSDAVRSIRAVLSHDPHSARAWFALGAALADDGDLTAAATAWTTAADLAPWSSAPARNLARLADRQGDIATAERWFGEVLAIEGADPEASAYLAAHA